MGWIRAIGSIAFGILALALLILAGLSGIKGSRQYRLWRRLLSESRGIPFIYFARTPRQIADELTAMKEFFAPDRSANSEPDAPRGYAIRYLKFVAVYWIACIACIAIALVFSGRIA
jgi:hypothetical protein